VPKRLYDINEADADSKAVNLEQLTIKEEDAWWNQVPLNNLDLSSNTLTPISSGKLVRSLCIRSIFCKANNVIVRYGLANNCGGPALTAHVNKIGRQFLDVIIGQQERS